MKHLERKIHSDGRMDIACYILKEEACTAAAIEDSIFTPESYAAEGKLKLRSLFV